MMEPRLATEEDVEHQIAVATNALQDVIEDGYSVCVVVGNWNPHPTNDDLQSMQCRVATNSDKETSVLMLNMALEDMEVEDAETRDGDGRKNDA